MRLKLRTWIGLEWRGVLQNGLMARSLFSVEPTTLSSSSSSSTEITTAREVSQLEDRRAHGRREDGLAASFACSPVAHYDCHERAPPLARPKLGNETQSHKEGRIIICAEGRKEGKLNSADIGRRGSTLANPFPPSSGNEVIQLQAQPHHPKV